MVHRFVVLIASLAVLALSSQADAQVPTWSDTLESIAISPDGKLLASGGASTVVAVWDINTGSVVRELLGNAETVRSVSFSPDGKLLASGGNDGFIRIWDVSSGQLVHELNLEVAVSAIDFSADGSVLVSGDLGGRIMVWDASSFTELRTMTGHGGFPFVNDLAISADGHYVISGATEPKAIIWDATAGEKFAEYESAHGGLFPVVTSVAFRPGTTYALSSAGAGELHTYNVGTQEHGVYEKMPNGAADMEFSPDGRFLVCGLNNDGGPNVMIVDFERGISRFLLGHFFPVRAVAFFPDGKRFVTSAYNGAFKIWDAATATAVDAFGPNACLDLPRTTSMRGVVLGENFDNNHLEWTISDDEDGYLSVQHGFYLVNYKDEEGGRFMWNEAVLDQERDFVIKTSIAHISGSEDEGFGLLWGLEDLNNYFSFNVTAGGYYRINKEADGEWTNIVEWTESPQIVSSNSSYVMTIEKIGDTFRFSCNDVQLHEMPVERFFGDQVGLSIWGQHTIGVDWLNVTQN